MGLERMATLLQGVDNLYEIDEVYPVLARAAELTGKRYGEHSGHSAGSSHPDDVRLRVVADHVRSSLMLIGDGVTPGNEGRGYVLRRMLRRSVRSMRLLGYEDPCLPELLPISLERMKQSYPELEAGFDRISQIAYAEEEAFRRTLAAGTTILDTAVARTKAAGGATLAGDGGVPAARHLRLPHRPHPRDGGRAGPRGRPRGLRAASCASSASGPRPTRSRRSRGTRTPRCGATCGPTGRPSSSPTRS